MIPFNSFTNLRVLLGSLGLVWLCFLPQHLTAAENLTITADSLYQKQDFTKNFNKTFTVSQKQTVVLVNKYGKIDVKTGNSNQVSVNVKVVVRTNSQQEADKTLQRINVVFSDGPDFVKSETIIDPNGNSSWFTWGNNSSDFRIDYEVVMPAQNRLDLTNKYGDSHIAALSDWVRIEQKYGNFKLESSKSASVTLAYGSGAIQKVGGLSGEIAYGKFNVLESKDVALKTKYSEMKIGKVDNLAIKSAYDDYELSTVENLAIDSKYGDFDVQTVTNLSVVSAYTDLKFQKIEQSADFQTSYGDVRIDGLRNGFDKLHIKGSYTDYAVNIESDVSYNLDFAGSYSDVSTVRASQVRYSLDKQKNNSRELIGTVGNPNTKSSVKVRLTYGDFLLK
jgi:hypothetical protein